MVCVNFNFLFNLRLESAIIQWVSFPSMAVIHLLVSLFIQLCTNSTLV